MKNNNKKDNGFAKRLKEVRKTAGISQTELSDKAGIHHMHISRYERGVSKPSAENLRKLADALDVSADFLWEGGSEEIAANQLQDKDLLSLFLDVEKLQEEDKDLVIRFVSSYVNERKIHKMTAH